jgi:urea transport system permease protein
MNRISLIFLMLSVLSIKVLAQHAQTVDETVNQLLKGNDSLKTLALTKLVETVNTDVFPLLSAINDKSLYEFEVKYVTAGSKNETSDDQPALFELVEVYPEGKILLDAKSKPIYKNLKDLKEIVFSRADRLLIAPLVPYLNLVSPLNEKRKLAYSQFQNNTDPSVIPMLAKALAKEKDEDILRLGKETLFGIQLNASTDNKLSKALVDSLFNNWGPNSASVLATYGAKLPSGDLKNYVLDKAKELDKKHEVLGIFQNLFSGKSLGSILIMIALGLSVIYGLAGVINMAHGEFLMIGAYTTFIMQNILPKNSDLFFWVSLPMGFLVAGIFGLIVERLIIRFLYSRPLESLLATWGVSLVLVQLARTIFGDLTAVRTPLALSGGWEIVPHLILPFNRLFIISLSMFMVFLTYYTLYKTRLGMQIRAVTQNRNMSSCLGIQTEKIDVITFFLGSGLAGLAGAAMTLIGNVVPDMGQTYIVDSFLVVVSGGVGNMFGSVFSGLGIGIFGKVFESFFEAVYGKVLVLVCIIIFLQYRPKGLFPDKGRIGDD